MLNPSFSSLYNGHQEVFPLQILKELHLRTCTPLTCNSIAMDRHNIVPSFLRQQRLIPYTPRDLNAYQQLSSLPCMVFNEATKDKMEHMCAQCGDRSPNQPTYGDIRVTSDALYVFYTIPCGHMRCTYCALEWLDTLGIFYHICRACCSEKGPGGVMPDLSFIFNQINAQPSAETSGSNEDIDIESLELQTPSEKRAAHPRITETEEETCGSLAYSNLDHGTDYNDTTMLEDISEVDEDMEDHDPNGSATQLSPVKTNRKRGKPRSSTETSPQKATSTKRIKLATLARP